MAGASDAGAFGPLEPARVNGRWRLTRADVRPQTFVHYGKQPVNPLAGLRDFVQPVAAKGPGLGRERACEKQSIIVLFLFFYLK
jgi:hypothetical protein